MPCNLEFGSFWFLWKRILAFRVFELKYESNSNLANQSCKEQINDVKITEKLPWNVD